MNHFFYQRSIRKDQHRSSKIPKKKYSKNQELINKLKTKIKLTSNNLNPYKRIRVFYHDRNFKSCYFYNLKLYDPKFRTHKHLYSEAHLPFIKFIKNHCENYANVLEKVQSFKLDYGKRGYKYDDYYSYCQDSSGGTYKYRDRFLRNKYQKDNSTLNNCQCLTEILSKVFILDLLVI